MSDKRPPDIHVYQPDGSVGSSPLCAAMRFQDAFQAEHPDRKSKDPVIYRYLDYAVCVWWTPARNVSVAVLPTEWT